MNSYSLLSAFLAAWMLPLLSSAETLDPVDTINPLSGTNGDAEFSRGNTVPAIVAPFGMTTWAPQTDGSVSPFYQMKHTRFEGIRATHQPSIWVRDYGDFLVMPLVGETLDSPKDRASDFSHAKESARAYHYSIFLDRYQVTAEIVPTDRCSLMRFTFPDSDKSAVVFDNEGEVDAAFDPSKRKIRGKAKHVTFGAPGNFAMYFVAEFDQPFEVVEAKSKEKMVTATVRFASTKSAKPVLMKIGTSFISYEQAELNMSREVPDWDFEGLRKHSRDAWAKELARVEIKGANNDQRSTFYTALYRSLQFPRMFHEPDAGGKLRHYSPFSNGKIFDGLLYTDSGLWDTFRTAFPFYVLYYPEHGSSILEGWLNAYREGGRLPTWPSPGNRPCMIGSHGDSIFADAWVKGLRTFDAKDAYAAVRKNATENDGWGWAGRDHLPEYMEKGYIPSDVRKEAATSCTLEYAYDDFCVSRLADALGHKEDAKLFGQRALNYRNVWDPKTGFMRGKLADGSWQEPFDPLAWGGPYVEGNAWQWTWSVMHDPHGLIGLLGGREAAATKLDKLLSMPPTSVVGGYGHVIHEMREVEFSKMGQYAHVNEPCHHVLYFYNYLGQPWKAQHAIRRVMDELYNKDGMVGDEDTGQMSAWYVFNAAGLYPFCPGTPYYLIGSPLFEETTIRFPGDKSFTVRARGNSPENRYIQSAKLNGQPFTKTWLPHEIITAGGTLEFVMGSEPNKNWGSAEADAPPREDISFSGGN
ncbi:GH92 family glycosyl hydrolase [Luteolibacter luteus]|uniref:Glycoside hydrolase family 92 protein n=1 Tax=Luteolibacter luteus TaxID=2728835 RepID=A0A858RJL5_9BACT|nr:GH92 family glycosyl hydrolase [Luteolibacter luteus]QJE96599.1 glycoside hydrolase family 92 protein [Luteolibacter luteus]